MVVDIELTRRAPDRYIARALQFPEIIIEAASREAALVRIRETLIARRRADTEMVQITIEPGDSLPQAVWPTHAGTFPDDEVYQAMLAEVTRQRQEQDSDLNL